MPFQFKPILPVSKQKSEQLKSLWPNFNKWINTANSNPFFYGWIIDDQRISDSIFNRRVNNYEFNDLKNGLPFLMQFLSFELSDNLRLLYNTDYNELAKLHAAAAAQNRNFTDDERKKVWKIQDRMRYPITTQVMQEDDVSSEDGSEDMEIIN